MKYYSCASVFGKKKYLNLAKSYSIPPSGYEESSEYFGDNFVSEFLGIPRIPSDFLGFPRVSEETKKFRNSGVDLAKRRRHDEVNVEKKKKSEMKTRRIQAMSCVVRIFERRKPRKRRK